MSTTNALDDRFDEAERGLEWLERLEALQARSASDRAAYEVAEYVMKLRTAVTELAGDRTASVLAKSVGRATAQRVEELRQARDEDYWNTRIRPRPSKIGPLTVAQFHSTAGPLCRWAACQSGEPAVWDGLPPLETQRRQPPERRTA